MKLSLDLKTSLSQILTPQQIQYLKLLQLPVVQLEQHIMHEIEQNPMLDEAGAEDLFDSPDYAEAPMVDDVEMFDDKPFRDDEIDSGLEHDYFNNDPEIAKHKIDDEGDPFEFYNMVWQDDSAYTPLSGVANEDDDDYEPYQIKENTPFTEDLYGQLSLMPLSEEELLLGSQIIGNVDEDGYLRRDFSEIIDETNSVIADKNFQVQQKAYLDSNKKPENNNGDSYNPARSFLLSNESKEILENAVQFNETGSAPPLDNKFRLNGASKGLKILKPVNAETGEKVLRIIQRLDPPGIGARDIRECLLAQLEAKRELTEAEVLAIKILEETYDPFLKKHYQTIMKQLEITEDMLKDAIDAIKRLNPKPGGSDSTHEHNTVIPDFIVDRDEDTDELKISVNDSRMPVLKLNKAYEALKREARRKNFNKETRAWIRDKHEDAKFLIQAIRQRKNTMLKVMTAIAGLQEDFFRLGKSALKPMIYKDVANATGLDISTVCRIVNGKYVLTEFGTFELKFFFSEALPTDEGEDMSTTVIKDVLREVIDAEPKSKPYSDDKLSQLLKERGLNVARRTVAKYREQMKIPVARLRVEL